MTFPLRSQRGLVSIPSGSARTRRHDKTYIDGFNFMPFFKGDVAKGPRQSIFFFDDTGKLNAVRVGDWKIHFAFSDHWYGGGPAKPQNFPQVVNLREDPFEAHIDDEHSPMYFRWACGQVMDRRARTGSGRPMVGNIQGIPDQPKEREFQHRPGA